MEFDSIDELVEYSKKIIGRTLNDIIDENRQNEIDHTMHETKGILGNLVETEFYHYPNNNIADADFENLGVELKTTGMIKNSRGIRAKERLTLSMINYMEIINEEFENSHLLDKNKLILILWYCYEKGVDFKDFKFITLFLYSLSRDEDIIRNDFNIIKNKVIEGKAHEISEGDTTYLGACIKGRNRKDTRIQPYSDIPARSRAFCLKNKYMTLLLNEMMENKKLPLKKNRVDYLSVTEYVKDKMKDYFGKTQLEIAEEIGIKLDNTKNLPKNLNKMISDKLIGKDSELSYKDEIFKYSSYIIKNSPIVKNKGFKERMSFRTIKISDFDDEWEDSEWKQYFEETSIINILYEFEKSSDKLGSGVLRDVQMFSLNADEIDNISTTFNMVQNAIRCYEKQIYGDDISKYVDLLPTPQPIDDKILVILPKSSRGLNSYYTIFDNEVDRTKVAFAFTKEFLNSKIKF